MFIEPYFDDPLFGCLDPEEKPVLIMVREMELVYRGEPTKYVRLGSSRDVDCFARTMGLEKKIVEHFIVILLDAKHRPIGWSTIAKGGTSSCPVSPSDVFRLAIRQNASGVILIHNHPSGEPTPSSEDIRLTERLISAGEIVGVPVLDHVVIGAEGYFSFLDAGLIK